MANKPVIPEAEWDSICARYRAKEDALVIATPYGVGREAIYRILRKRGITLEKRGGNPPVSDEIRARICTLYKDEKMGATFIARQFGIDKRSVYNILTYAGIGTRPRSNRTGDDYHRAPCQERRITRPRLGHERGPKGGFNKDAFKDLDEAACYWAGYLITDGCIGAYDGRSYRLHLLQARKHREQCEKLKGYLQSDLDVMDHQAETFGKMRDFSRVSFTLPEEVAQRLLALGVCPAKTAKAQAALCLVDKPAFWRGVIDGDGTCYPQSIRMNSSSPRLANQYRGFVENISGKAHNTWRIYQNQEGVWILPLTGTTGFMVADTLYSKAGVDTRLERKYRVAINFISWYKKKNPGP